MRTLTFLVILLLPVFLSCDERTPVSEYKFYTEGDVVFDVALLGDWVKEDADEPTSLWQFRRFGDYVDVSGPEHYLLSHSSFTWFQDIGKYLPEKSQDFEAFLFELDGVNYLDVVPVQGASAGNPVYLPDAVNDMLSFCGVFGHFLMTVSQIGPTLEVEVLPQQAVEDYLAEHPGALKAEYWQKESEDDGDYEILLHSDTAELQEFIRVYRDMAAKDKAAQAQADSSQEAEDVEGPKIVRLADSEHLAEIDLSLPPYRYFGGDNKPLASESAEN